MPCTVCKQEICDNPKVCADLYLRGISLNCLYGYYDDDDEYWSESDDSQ